MVNRQRMIDDFIELCGIDSLSLKEKNMADRLKNKLANMGLEVYEDDAGTILNGETGNLICKFEGNKDVPAIAFVAHMDTVVPGLGKIAVVEGDIIKSEGTTILGADDVAGIVPILEAIRILKERNVSHGDIYIVFTIAEELGLLGAKNLDYSKINAQYGFVLDVTGRVGGVVVKQPIKYSLFINIIGKAAHSGLEPEKGISAIQIASDAIASMKLGRIDEETTANIGTITGGKAVNIVCDRVEMKAEVRSMEESKLHKQVMHMKNCFDAAVGKYGGSVEFMQEEMYPSYSIDEKDEIVKIVSKAAERIDLELRFIATGGGSDTSIFNLKGIKSVNLSCGFEKAHTLQEKVYISDMVKSAELLLAIVEHGLPGSK